MLLMPALKKRLQTESAVGHLPTLGGILRNLGAFTQNPETPVSEISEHISCDPSLSVRLLRIANSAYYGRVEPVVSIDEAVLFLGVEQIRMVSLTTRCVEVMSPEDKIGFHWEDFWRHCIAAAYLSCMMGRFFRRSNYSELDYMAGLLHDVGKLVIAMLSPEGFGYIINKAKDEKLSFHTAEKTYFDTDHGALGGWYLERQNLPPIVSEAVRCHHHWSLSVKEQEMAAIVNVADFLARSSHVGCSGNMEPIAGSFQETPAWNFLVENLPLKEDLPTIEVRMNEEMNRLGSLIDTLLPKAETSSKESSESAIG